MLSPYVIPNNFKGILESSGVLRVEVIVAADNAESTPIALEIAWDGLWSDDSVQMKNHLVVKQVARTNATTSS